MIFPSSLWGEADEALKSPAEPHEQRKKEDSAVKIAVPQVWITDTQEAIKLFIHIHLRFGAYANHSESMEFH